MREGRHAPWTDWLLLILFVGFQVADIASTNYLRGILPETSARHLSFRRLWAGNIPNR